MCNIDWDDTEALEIIANQSIYNGVEVARARAALKAIHGYDVLYDDELEENCSYDTKKIIKANQ